MSLFSKKQKHKDIYVPSDPKNGGALPSPKPAGGYYHMKLSSVLFIGYRNMLANKLRSFLTVGGVAIGIGTITLLISLGFGVQSMVIHEVTKNNPSNIIDISNKSLENFALLDKNTVEKIRNIEGVDQMEVRTSIGGKFSKGESQTDAVINAVSEHYLDLARPDMSKEVVEKIYTQEKGILITPKLATLLGFEKPEDIVGQQVTYEMTVTSDMLADVDTSATPVSPEEYGNELTVMGIVKDLTKDDAVYAYISLPEIQKRYGPVAGQFAKVKVSSEDRIEATRLQIEQTAFTTESVIDTIADINSFFTIVRAVLVVFGVIIMSISAMGMLNTMSISLLQRTKEVGILKALGTKRADIFKMFIFEAFLISFFGGSVGLLFGYGAAKGINYGVNILAGKYGVAASTFVEIPSVFVISVTIFIFFLGLITGLLPAMRASKIHALEALRYE